MKVSDRSIDSEAHLVAFPTDLLHSSMHLFCHKGQTAFHGCSVPFCFKHKYRGCFKLNFIYAYALCNEVYQGGGRRVKFHRLIRNIRTRACATLCDDLTFGTPSSYTGCIGFKSRTLILLSWLKVFVGFLTLQANARMLLKTGSQPLRSSSFAIQYSFTIRYATDRVSDSVVQFINK